MIKPQCICTVVFCYIVSVKQLAGKVIYMPAMTVFVELTFPNG